MRYDILHTTEYRYSQPVVLGHSSLHLHPRPLAHQTCRTHALDIVPVPTTLTARSDYFGNPVTFFTLEEPHTVMTVTSRATVDVAPVSPVPVDASTPWEAVRNDLAARTDGRSLDAYQFAFDSSMAGSARILSDYAQLAFTPGRPILEAALELNAQIHRDFTFDPKATTTTTPVAQVFQLRRGVCQDFAHLMIACLRSLGLPARYVSGYLRTHPPPGKPRLVGADASHAWVGVYCPEVGWADFDPTNDQLVGSDHVTLAWGRDYSDVTPVKGLVLGGGEHRLTVSVDIHPHEA